MGKDNKHIGNINAYIDLNNSTADIGILIGFPRHGYGLKAWKLMINKLFITKKTAQISPPLLATSELDNLYLLHFFKQCKSAE